MTPEQCKVKIIAEYKYLINRANKKEINYNCILRIIESRAREAARHNGIPEYWHEYIPKMEKIF